MGGEGGRKERKREIERGRGRDKYTIGQKFSDTFAAANNYLRIHDRIIQQKTKL